MRNLTFEEDRVLEKISEIPREQKPSFDWAGALGDNRFEVPKVRIDDGAGDRDFEIAEVAEVIGEALTDLMISREEEDIYTEKNRELVVESTRSVADRLVERTIDDENNDSDRMTYEELYRLIEKVLVENDAYDVAKSRTVESQQD
jgi:ribonucleoside-diphosphate reductase alpha chain